MDDDDGTISLAALALSDLTMESAISIGENVTSVPYFLHTTRNGLLTHDDDSMNTYREYLTIGAEKYNTCFFSNNDIRSVPPIVVMGRKKKKMNE